ncbi:MAG: pentapeptide repeat-containing protein [Candidatus Saccharimonadales bacterium]
MKLAQPKLSANPEDAAIAVMIDDGELEAVRLHDETAINCNVVALQLIDVMIERVQFTGAHFSRIVARDLLARQVDFSSAHLDNGLLVRAEFINCRMTGVDFSQTNIHDVTFKDCKLDNAIFHKADLRRVEFINCDLSAVDFSTARLSNVKR